MERKNSATLFNQSLLEALTRTHIAFPLVLFYSSAAILMGVSFYYGLVSPASNTWMFLAGVWFFTLIEYIVHRFAYHADTENATKTRLKYMFHGLHHDHPRDKRRLAMPPLASAVVVGIFFGIYRLLLGDYGIPFTAGTLFGYASYLCVHYSVHVFRPPNNLLRNLWVHHAIHHHIDDEVAYGVSSPFWDVIFGTMPGKEHYSGVKKKHKQNNT